jgi:hypothetical protein
MLSSSPFHTMSLSPHWLYPGNRSQHRNYHFKSVWSLLIISSSVTSGCRLSRTRPNSLILSSLVVLYSVLLYALSVVFPFPWFLTLYSSVLLCTTNRLPLYRRGVDHIENISTLVWCGSHRKRFYCCVVWTP